MWLQVSGKISVLVDGSAQNVSLIQNAWRGANLVNLRRYDIVTFHVRRSVLSGFFEVWECNCHGRSGESRGGKAWRRSHVMAGAVFCVCVGGCWRCVGVQIFVAGAGNVAVTPRLGGQWMWFEGTETTKLLVRAA